jgi:uncharacterized protein (DUF1800 family)
MTLIKYLNLILPGKRATGMVCVACFLFSVVSSRASTDFDGDGYDDVWQFQYGVTTNVYPLEADNDGDGVSNQDESFAGTNPGDSNEVLKVMDVLPTASNVAVEVTAKTGKLYQLQSRDATAMMWTDESAPVIGNGTLIPLSGDAGGTTRIFRAISGDVDSDGDGVSDYVEAITGTDPSLATSGNNASGGATNDLETLRSLLSVSATVLTSDAFRKEGTSAVIRISRTYGTMPLTIPFATSGATNSTKGSATTSDYSFVGATLSNVSFAANESTRDILINPLVSSGAKVPRTLRLTFHLTGNNSATNAPVADVRIKDATVIPENRRLYVAYLGREAGVPTTASGVATALVEGDNDSAIINLTFANLSSVQNNSYIRLGAGLEVQFIPLGQVSGFSWLIRAKQYLLTDQAMLDALAAGQLFISVSSANFPAGEIRGTFQLANGSIADPPDPPDPPAYLDAEFPNLAAGGVTNNPALDRDIVRLLMQSTFGPTADSIQEVRDLIATNGNDMLAGYTAWINKQMNLAQTPSPSLLKLVQAADMEEFILRNNKPINYNNDPQFGGNSFQFSTSTRLWNPDSIHQNNYPFENNARREWWTLVLNSRDQLRQRMAMALHEIVVISMADTTISDYYYGAVNYWDMLAANAFGTYRTILENVTYSPMMGIYLSHLKNQAKTGSISPDENYARDIIQLFSIGLIQRHLDGSLKLDPVTALPVATYDQADVTEMARVMTGLSFGKVHAAMTNTPTYPNPTTQSIGAETTNGNFFAGNGHRMWQAPWLNPMAMFPAYHDFNGYTNYTGLALPTGVVSASKILFRGKTGETIIPMRTTNAANGNLDIADALDALAGHPNAPAFISRLLIQRFTSANPSAGYLHRVATKYQQTGGNLGEVIKAILLDYEARSLDLADNIATVGKPKEPILHFTALVRGLKCITGAPLSALTTMPVTFSSIQSSVTNAYEMTEYNKFPANSWRFRWFDTTSGLTQSPQDAPSVFNWFLPDYIVPGPLAEAGLVAPELQVATEGNVVNVINSHYTLLFASIPPGTTNEPGTSLDDFRCMAQYQTAAGVQLSVPQYGVDAGYFSGTTFDGSFGGTEVPNTIDSERDNVLPDFSDLTTLYSNVYSQTMNAIYTNSVPASPANTNRFAAHTAAAVAVLDQCDMLFAAGTLKARFGSLPSTTPNPRQYIINALTSGNVGSTTTLPNASNNGFLTNAQTRTKNIVYLVVTSPYAIILR